MTKRIHILSVFALLAMALAYRPAVAGAPVKLVVVVAAGSPVQSLSRADLKRTFSSEAVVVAGKKLVPFNYNPGTPERGGFDKAVLGMSPDEAGRFWIDRKVRGQAPAPRALPSTAHMQKVIAKFPGAIGYVPESQLTPELQAVKIDGLAYGDKGYAILSL